MTGAWATITINDASNNPRTMRVWDESGSGSGPYSPGQMLTDGTPGGENSVTDIKTSLAVLGAKTDAANASFDTTSVSSVGIWKQVSKSVQAVATSVAAALSVKLQDGSGTSITSTGNAIDVNIKSGAGSGGTADTDESSFTEGTTNYTPVGGVYKTSHTALTSGQGGAVSMTAAREMIVSVSNTQLAPLQTTYVPVSNGASLVAVSSDQPTFSVSQDCTKVSVGLSGNTAIPNTAIIALSGTFSGANTIVPLASSKTIKVLALAISANAAVQITWQNHAGANVSGPLICANTGDGEVLPYNPVGWFSTASGVALDIFLSANVAVSGHLTYIAV